MATAATPLSTAIVASVIALDRATQTAFPTARCEARLPFGSRHEDGKPIKTELSRAVITRTVWRIEPLAVWVSGG